MFSSNSTSQKTQLGIPTFLPGSIKIKLKIEEVATFCDLLSLVVVVPRLL